MKIARVFILILGSMQLGGCTVFGIIADTSINDKLDKGRPVMPPAKPEEPITEFASLGLETDIKIVKKAIKVLTPAKAEPVTRCEFINQRRICYQQGSERY